MIYHVVGADKTTGLRVSNTSGWRWIVASFDFIRMPVFTALSGYLYAQRRVTRRNLHIFGSKKVRRIIVPLLFMTVFVWATRHLVYGDRSGLLHALTHHYEHLWFLQALALIFIIVAVWDVISPPDWVSLSLGCFVAVIVGRSWAVTDVMSLNGAVYLFPYFTFGMLLRMRPAFLSSPESRTLSVGMFIVVMVDHEIGLAGYAAPIGKQLLPAIICGMSVIVLLMQRMPAMPALGKLGSYSYTIYLWHPVAAAATRSALMHAGVHGTGVLFAPCLAAGLFGPVAIHHVAIRLPLISVLATGTTWTRRTDKCLALHPAGRGYWHQASTAPGLGAHPEAVGSRGDSRDPRADIG